MRCLGLVRITEYQNAPTTFVVVSPSGTTISQGQDYTFVGVTPVVPAPVTSGETGNISVAPSQVSPASALRSGHGEGVSPAVGHAAEDANRVTRAAQKPIANGLPFLAPQQIHKTFIVIPIVYGAGFLLTAGAAYFTGKALAHACSSGCGLSPTRIASEILEGVAAPVVAGVSAFPITGPVRPLTTNVEATNTGGTAAGEEAREATPATDPNRFKPVRGRSGKVDAETGEIWEKDKLHKDHYEVYKNQKDYDKGRRDRDVWSDGRPKGKK